MTIIFDQYTVPETKGVFEIKKLVTLNVTAAEAQKIAGRWLRDEVAFRLTAMNPTLVIEDERTVWRVPAMYTSTHIGHVGEVGTVNIDVETEKIYASNELKDSMLSQIMFLAKTLPPFEPRKLEGADINQTPIGEFDLAWLAHDEEFAVLSPK